MRFNLRKFVFVFCCALLAGHSIANIERIHLLIPGGAGGGWDSTARGVGEALARSGLVEAASYENMSGGGGSRAISHLIETADRQHDTLMISSTPIILLAIKGLSPQSYHELTPIAVVVADYGAFVVRADSKYKHWSEVIADYKQDARRVKVAGGSSRGSMDHLVAALAIKKSGAEARELRYIPYNAGAHAMVGLLSGETQLLSTGLSEALALAEQGEVRILAMTAEQRLPNFAHIPTLVEQGAPAQFANWRGFFAAPGIPADKIESHQQLLKKMTDSKKWESIRQNRGWSHLFIAGDEFEGFLQQQEKELKSLMLELGLTR